MSRGAGAWTWVLGVGLVAGGGLATLALLSSASAPIPLPRTPRNKEGLGLAFSDDDVEAAARMVASENPRGSARLHIEQIYTQLRARKSGQSLHDRITAGSGWGEQGEGERGRRRPVATTERATDAHRRLAREVLSGQHPSSIPGARKFFEPGAQDRAFAIGERARAKQTRGEPLSRQEQRLLKYRKSAAKVRADWTKDGDRSLGMIETVEFWT